MTDIRTDRPTDKPTERRTDGHGGPYESYTPNYCLKILNLKLKSRVSYHMYVCMYVRMSSMTVSSLSANCYLEDYMNLLSVFYFMYVCDSLSVAS